MKNFNRGVTWWRGFGPQSDLLLDTSCLTISERKLGGGWRESELTLAGRVALHRLDQSVDGIAGAGTHGTCAL